MAKWSNLKGRSGNCNAAGAVSIAPTTTSRNCKIVPGEQRRCAVSAVLRLPQYLQRDLRRSSQ